MDKFEDLPLLSEEDEKKFEAGKLPFSGLLGNSVLLRVVEEIVADPDREFRPKNLQILTASSPPRIKNALDALTKQGLLRKTSTDSQRPAYRINLESKRLMALTLLAHAVIDDRDKTDYMDQLIMDYCSDMAGDSFTIQTHSDPKYVIYVENYNTIYNTSPIENSPEIIDLSGLIS